MDMEEMESRFNKIMGLIPKHCKLPMGRFPVIFVGTLPAGHREQIKAFFDAVEDDTGAKARVLEFKSTIPDDVARAAYSRAKPSIAKMLALDGAEHEVRITNGPMGLVVMVQGVSDVLQAAACALELELEGFGGDARIIVVDEGDEPPEVREYQGGVKPRPATSVKFKDSRDHQALAQGEIEEHEGPAHRICQSDCTDLSILLHGRNLDVLDFIKEAERLRD